MKRIKAMTRMLLIAIVPVLILTGHSGCGMGGVGSSIQSISNDTNDGAADEAAGHHEGGHSHHGAAPMPASDEPSGSGSGQAADEARKVKAVWTWIGGKPKAGEEALLRIAIVSGEGKLVDKLDIGHEKKLHLIVVSRGLSEFMHLHPVEAAGGVFETRVTFPSGGDYKLTADYIPSDIGATTSSSWVQVKGEAPLEPALAADRELEQAEEGVRVNLAFHHQPKAGEEAVMTFSFKEDAGEEQPIRDLQPYLGAIGHVVIMDSKAQHYLHVHPLDDQGTGPEAAFATTFPASGMYKIWGQFQRGGKVFVVSFVLNVT
ncbi:hypothetical protein [Paenibacillus spongiae]|uniref:Secreted protein n=1 Tax=Paenibacillus spongiae TaxID=2909671 RepID=A0ABY5SAC8_9BACL|nr:hypothetical protein [Paenibacillus spongiae]UVI30879.1 hypothetical protein L1F29_03110 [Paenibacillus spongiae]